MLIMAVCYSTSAFAAVDPYEAMQITPAEGEVTSLQHFTITFADLPVVVRPNCIPTLEKGGGGTVEGTMRADADGKTVIIEFEECFTTPGHYFLNIPDNSLVVNGQTLLPLTLRFIIPVTPESFYEQITIDPAEGVVESLQSFTVSLPLMVGEIEYGMEAKLTNTTTGESWSTDMYDVRYNVLMYFPEEVTAPGDYVLTIPAGAIIIYTLGEQVHELNFHYTIAGGTPVDPYEVMQITPAEGNVTSLQNFTITFANLPVTVNEDAVPTLEKGGGNTAEGTMRVDEDGKTVIIEFEECFTAGGHYFLNIPDGALVVNGQPLLPLTFRYSIPVTPESFYEQITIDPAEGVVESLQSFTVSLPLMVGEIEYGMEAKLTNTTTGESWSTDMYDVRYNVLMYFPEEVTAPGDYVLTIPAGAIIIYTLGEQVHELNFHYTIGGGTGPIPGDVDGDGSVNIADVTALIDILLNAIDVPADVDGDGAVNIGDVTALIDMLLNGN